MGGVDSAHAWQDFSDAFMTLRRPPPRGPQEPEPALELGPPSELEPPPKADRMPAQAPPKLLVVFTDQIRL
jgi:hypothetical protein